MKNKEHQIYSKELKKFRSKYEDSLKILEESRGVLRNSDNTTLKEVYSEKIKSSKILLKVYGGEIKRLKQQITECQRKRSLEENEKLLEFLASWPHRALGL